MWWIPACAGTTYVRLIAWLMGPSIYACITRRLIPLFLHERYRQCRVTLGKSHLPSVTRPSHLPSAIIECFIQCFVHFELSFQIELILNSITVRNC